jgi:hypothetical protein
MEICSDSDDDDCILLENPDCEEESIVSRDHVLGAVHALEKPLIVPNLDSDSEDCILLDLEDTKMEFPKPMKSGTFLDDNNNLGLQEIEIDDLLTAVTESCSEIQGKLNVVEAGPPIVVSMENQMFIGSQESFASGQHNNSVRKLPEPQVDNDLEPHKVTAVPRIVDLRPIKTSGSNGFGECSAESVNKSMEIPGHRIIDCLPGPSKSSDVGEEILASQNQKKSQETQTDGRNSEQRSLRRNRRKLTYTVSESESDDTSDRPLNGKRQKNSGDSWDPLKRHMESTETRRLTGEKKTWECHKCGKKVCFKSELITHFQSHNTTKDFHCSFCGKAFKLQNTRYVHEQIHTAPKVRCNICGMECKNNFALKTHLWYWHSNQGRVQCQICQKVLSTKYVLRDHVKKVHGSN